MTPFLSHSDGYIAQQESANEPDLCLSVPEEDDAPWSFADEADDCLSEHEDVLEERLQEDLRIQYWQRRLGYTDL
jgi:hypothetical protein